MLCISLYSDPTGWGEYFSVQILQINWPFFLSTTSFVFDLSKDNFVKIMCFCVRAQLHALLYEKAAFK